MNRTFGYSSDQPQRRCTLGFPFNATFFFVCLPVVVVLGASESCLFITFQNECKDEQETNTTWVIQRGLQVE